MLIFTEIYSFRYRICDEFEEMSMHAGERPKETAEVVALQNYLCECKEERIVKLKDEIKKAAERVIFLLYHANFHGMQFEMINHHLKYTHRISFRTSIITCL